MNDLASVPDAAPAPTKGQVVAKAIDFAKVDALRRHMLLTVTSLVAILGTSRVTYYNWLKGTQPHDVTAGQVREIVRKLVTLVSTNQWPNGAVYVAKQSDRLLMLQEALKNLDKEAATQ